MARGVAETIGCQHSTGRLTGRGTSGISKQGDRCLRSLFTAGALAVIRYAKIHGTGAAPGLPHCAACLFAALHMSPNGTTRTYRDVRAMSAVGGNADIGRRSFKGRYNEKPTKWPTVRLSQFDRQEAGRKGRTTALPSGLAMSAFPDAFGGASHAMPAGPSRDLQILLDASLCGWEQWLGSEFRVEVLSKELPPVLRLPPPWVRALSLLLRRKFRNHRCRLGRSCDQLRDWRSVPGKGERQRELALFPGYAFLLVRLQWHAGRWCPVVIRLVMDGLHPAKVPDAVIDEIRMREHNGAVEIPRRQLKAGDRVKILSGPFNGQLAIYAGMSGFERVEVLLQILGGAVRVTLASEQVEALN